MQRYRVAEQKVCLCGMHARQQLHLAHEQVDVLVNVQVLEPLGVARQLHQQAAIAHIHLRGGRGQGERAAGGRRFGQLVERRQAGKQHLH